LTLLLEKEFDVRVLALPGGADPDKFIKEKGVDAYAKLLVQSPPYLDYLIGRARLMDRTTAQGKVAALNFLMPYVQRLPNRLLRSEWATRISSELRVDEPVLREALRIAANERRSEVKPKAVLLTPAIKRAERQLIKMLFEAAEFRERLAQEIALANLHHGLETRNIFEALISALAAGEIPDASALSSRLDDKDRRLIFEILFEALPEGTWDDAESCLNFLRNLPVTEELATLQRQIEAAPPADEMKRLVVRRMELLRQLSSQRELDKNLPIQ
jgi:DNA primase